MTLARCDQAEIKYGIYPVIPVQVPPGHTKDQGLQLLRLLSLRRQASPARTDKRDTAIKAARLSAENPLQSEDAII